MFRLPSIILSCNITAYGYDMGDQQQPQQQQLPPSFKQMSLDKIIEAMTADLESSAGHYVQFGMSPQQSSSQSWGDYSAMQRQHFLSNPPMPQNATDLQSGMNPMLSPIYMQDAAPFEASRSEPMYFPPQTVNHLGINEKNDLVGTIDVGGGNYIDVIYGNASQIVAEQRQLNGLSSYANQGMIDREYGLFGEQQQLPMHHNKLANQSTNGKQLIDNLVGNWAPNQSGTYSPFGGSPNVTPAPQSNPRVNEPSEILPRTLPDTQQKKPRMIAEVKPMRPTYSDVLTKSPPLSISPITSIPVKPQPDSTAQKKLTNKSGKNKSKPVLLKRQNSSGSDDHGSPKIQVPKRAFERNNSNLSRRWVSLDNVSSQLESHEIKPFSRSDNFEKKKNAKPAKKCERTGEALNNCKLQSSNSKSGTNPQKRPIQINNNLNNINSLNQSTSNDKIAKNQHANNKINKDEKKVPKEKTSKRLHAEKALQIKKGQKNRYRDSKESSVKDWYRHLNKYASRWTKFGLKMFYWLLHLISDVVSMSTNLVVQL